MKKINTDAQLRDLLKSGKIIVLDQPEQRWFIFNESEESDDTIDITVEQFETLEQLANSGAIYKNTFMVSNTSMLLSYMTWEVANDDGTKSNKENAKSEFEI